MWFRRDLRLADHPALCAAAAEGPVVPLFVVDPAFAGAGAARQRALAVALANLSASIDGGLVVRHGPPPRVVAEVAAEVGAGEVLVTRDAGPYGRRRDAAVAEALRADGRVLRGVGWNTIAAPGSIRKADGSPYAVFTPYLRAWRAAVGRADPITVPDVRWHPVTSEVPPSADDPRRAWPGEQTAARRWAWFATEALDVYATNRDRPDRDGTSRLSADLRWGTVHPRRLVADLPEPGPPGSADSASRYLAELVWREFYADVLHRRPDAATRPLDQRFERLAVDRDGDARRRFQRWASGTTGFPIVDAGMRQLTATGWMHNRVRMLTASFLVKDLHLPWQWGAAHFLDRLADGDLASNSLGWQWVAGTGTDAAPFFRIFNPTTQARRFDPEGDYVRRWVPELAGVAGPAVHDPGRGRPSAYPAPMVEHLAERAEALARYAAVTAGGRAGHGDSPQPTR